MASTSRVSCGEALARARRQEHHGGVIAMILAPLPRVVLPAPEPPFGPAEGGVDEAFAQIRCFLVPPGLEPASAESLRNVRPAALLKSTMAGLIRWIAVGKVLPLRSGAQNPEHTVERFSCIPSWSSPVVGSTSFHKHRLQNLPLSTFRYILDWRTIALSYLLCALFSRRINTFSL